MTKVAEVQAALMEVVGVEQLVGGSMVMPALTEHLPRVAQDQGVQYV
jgi:hypothetical protein